jgi:transcriptional regulator with XRE-family HTH domain
MLNQIVPHAAVIPQMTCAMPKKIRINAILFGKLVAAHRRRLRMNQQELARYLYKGEKLSDAGAQSRMSRIESGKIQITRKLIDQVSKLFDIPARDIRAHCAEDFVGFQTGNENSLQFDQSIMEYMPTIAGYIQIINAHLRDGNLKGVTFGFQQLCEAAHQFSSLDPSKHKKKKDTPH